MRPGPKKPPTAAALPALRGKTPARRVEEFFTKHLRHCKGALAGRPLRLASWQRDQIIAPLFDTLQPDGLRRYRTCYASLPRKSGKSTLAAGIALALLYTDHELGADVVSAAADREQAAVVFDIARRMVERSPALAAMTAIYRRELVIPSTGSRYKVISSESYTKHGLNLSGVVIDELHAHPSRDLYDVLTTSMGARRQPLTVIISTAGSDEHSICAEVHRYSEKVRDGIIEDPTWLPIIYAAPEDADPWDEAVWFACNPALADFRSLEEMRQVARHAKEVPGREAAFRRLYLNQWGTAAEQKWLSLAAWDACAEGKPLLASNGLASLPERRVFIGLDLAATIDLTALVILVPDDEGGYDVRAEFWCPADLIAERSRRDRVPYELWRKQGHLHATPGNVVDYAAIAARLHALMHELDVAEVGCDPWNAKGFIADLQRDGVPIVEVPQTMAGLSSACKELERLVLSRGLRHDGHPILRWNVSNTVCDLDANGNLKPSKKRSVEKIDGVSALVTGLARAILQRGASVYDTHDPLLVEI
jgi:phage terminase large subunit-like protein